LKDKEATVKQIKFGFENMPPFPDLSNQQIADLINYISNSWGNSFGKISAKEVENALK
jgi:mono/diheme cytochrome c family protein